MDSDSSSKTFVGVDLGSSEETVAVPVYCPEIDRYGIAKGEVDSCGCLKPNISELVLNDAETSDQVFEQIKLDLKIWNQMQKIRIPPPPKTSLNTTYTTTTTTIYPSITVPNTQPNQTAQGWTAWTAPTYSFGTGTISSPNSVDEKNKPSTSLEYFIKHHADRSYVTDRGHAPLPMSSLEEAFKDIKFVLVDFRGGGHWRTDSTVHFSYSGLFCFFTRENDEYFENETFENFHALEVKQPFEIKAVGKMSCLLTADLSKDTIAEIVRNEFFKQFPKGAFDNRTKKLNQRIFFIKTQKRNGTIILKQHVGVSVYTIDTYSTNDRHSYNYDYDPIAAIVYINARGLNLFCGISNEFGAITKDWVDEFIRKYFPRPKSTKPSFISDEAYKAGWEDTEADGISALRRFSFPDRTIPASYFKSSALLLMLLTNYLAEWETKPDNSTVAGNKIAPNAYKIEKWTNDETDVEFFCWIFREWWLMKDENIFKAIAYESKKEIDRHPYIVDDDIGGSSFVLNRNVRGEEINIARLEKNDNFLKRESLEIVPPKEMEI